jgi:hypothetical protein
MTRDNQGFLGALVIFGLLIVGVWFVRRPDHAKPNPDPPVESSNGCSQVVVQKQTSFV